MEILNYGWSWQMWSEEMYPGPFCEFWMKCCPRCWKGPLTGSADSKWELCPECNKKRRSKV